MYGDERAAAERVWARQGSWVMAATSTVVVVKPRVKLGAGGRAAG